VHPQNYSSPIAAVSFWAQSSKIEIIKRKFLAYSILGDNMLDCSQVFEGQQVKCKPIETIIN
jgi:hypothetical protein